MPPAMPLSARRSVMRWIALLLLWPVVLLSLACEEEASAPTPIGTVAVEAADTPVAETPLAPEPTATTVPEEPTATPVPPKPTDTPSPSPQVAPAPMPTVAPTAAGTVAPRRRTGLGFGHPPFCIEIGEVSICF
jgi:outer membrane biosynthesis protein TonB